MEGIEARRTVSP